MRASWQLYLSRDPNWPSARRQWISHGDDARKILVENLLAEFIRGIDHGDALRRDRAAAELVDLGQPAVTHLLEAIRVGDDVVGKECASVLGRIGTPATDAVLGALDGSTPRMRLRLFDAMGGIGGGRVGEVLRRALVVETDWRLRAAAAGALGRAKSPGSLEALVGATRDADPLVRARAAAALGDLGDRRAAGRLIELLESSRASGDPGDAAVVRDSGASLRALTGEAIGDDPRAWREWQARASSGR